MNTNTKTIHDDLMERLIDLGRLLVDQQRAKVIVPPQKNAPGFWFGGGNLVKGPDGYHYVVGRYRNAGDSRTGLGAGERGLELAIFKSTDRCRSFNKVLSFSKSDLDVEGRTTLSIEGSALEYTDDGVRLLVSTEKSAIDYPQELKEFHKPGTGVWTIEELVAPSLYSLKGAARTTILSSDRPEHLHVKDPFLMPPVDGRRRIGFCTHPFNWSSSNTSIAEQSCDGSWSIVFGAMTRGDTWDVAISRATCVVPLSALGLGTDKDRQLLFYDGGECMRPLDQHAAAVKRPRGYSCEELGGLALVTDPASFEITRVSRFVAAFVSPQGTGCSRYVDVLVDDDTVYTTWQQGQTDGSQPLVLNTVTMDAVRGVFS